MPHCTSRPVARASFAGVGVLAVPQGERVRRAGDRCDLDAGLLLLFLLVAAAQPAEARPGQVARVQVGHLIPSSYFDQVAFLRTHASSSLVQRELCTVEVEAATLMGQLVWDASQRHDHATTRAYLAQAITAARQIPDGVAEGHALLRMAFVSLYTEKKPQVALDLALQAAERAANRSLVMRGLGLLHAAEAYAMLGRRSDCEHALGEAETCFEQISPVDAAIEMFSPAQYGRLAGSCYLLLNDAKRAESMLENAAQSLQDRPKSHAIVLGNLALARLRQEDLEMATASLHAAIDLVEMTRGGGGLNVVFNAGRELQQWRELPIVRDVQDRLFRLVAA